MRGNARWLAEQAAAPRNGELTAVDLRNVAEELDGLGRAEARAGRERIGKLLTHLELWHTQQSKCWPRHNMRIDRQRIKILDLLDDSPSLHARLPEFISNQ
jgi:hypothetical protein